MEPSVPQFWTSVQVTGPLNVPLKITAGRPSPLPMIWKLPPPASIAPVIRFPEISAPVVKLKLPHGTEVEQVPSPKPVTPVSAEPLRVRPAELPARVPPVLLKSILPANAATGRARA